MPLLENSIETNLVFISKKLNPISPLFIELNAMGYEVKDEALIKFDQIRFTHTPHTQWIFFSSRNAISYFFAQQPQVPEQVKYGVMSRASADHLLEYSKNAHFIGTGVDVTKIAKEFAEVVKDETVLFPQAINSLQTIQKHLSFTNVCHNLFVYKTILRTDFEMAPAKILAFTSPSNVQAYFDKYKLIKGQRTVAIGSTTADKLKEYGIKDIALASSFDDMGMLQGIKQHLQTKAGSPIKKDL